MPRTCTICFHKKRAEIDASLVAGEPIRAIACRFSVGRASLQRHQREHLPAQLLKAKAFQETEDADDLVRRLREIHRTTQRILSRALAKNDGELALKAIQRLEKQLELEGRLLGELEDRGTTLQRVEVVYVDKMLIASPGGMPNAQQAIEAGSAARRLGTGGPTRDVGADSSR